MPVLGVASKLRQPAVGSKPVHTALPIPNLGPAGSQKYSPKSLELTGAESPMLSCQLTLKSTCDFGERKTLQGKTQDIEDSKVSCKLYLWNSIVKKPPNVDFSLKINFDTNLLHAKLGGK